MEQNKYQRKLLEDVYIQQITGAQDSFESELRVTEEVKQYLEETAYVSTVILARTKIIPP